MLVKYIAIQRANKNYEVKAIPDEFMSILLKYKMTNTCCDTNNSVVLSNVVLKDVGVLGKRFLKIRLKTDNTIKERIAQVFSVDMGTSEAIKLSDTFLHNFGIANIQQCVNLIYVKDPPLKVATEVDISLFSVHNGISTVVTDDILKRYFRTPKILYRNDIIAIDIQIYGAEYYYTSKQMNEMRTIYFKCNTIILEENKNHDGPCICVSDQTCLKQSADIQSFIPRRLSNQQLIEEDIVQLDGALIEVCPYGLDYYVNDIEKAITPFLDKSLLDG